MTRVIRWHVGFHAQIQIQKCHQMFEIHCNIQYSYIGLKYILQPFQGFIFCFSLTADIRNRNHVKVPLWALVAGMNTVKWAFLGCVGHFTTQVSGSSGWQWLMEVLRTLTSVKVPLTQCNSTRRCSLSVSIVKLLSSCECVLDLQYGCIKQRLTVVSVRWSQLETLHSQLL